MPLLTSAKDRAGRYKCWRREPECVAPRCSPSGLQKARQCMTTSASCSRETSRCVTRRTIGAALIRIFRSRNSRQARPVLLANATKQRYFRFAAHDLRACLAKPPPQPCGVVMILLQTRHVMLQRIQSGRRQNPGLTHSAADRLRQRRAFNVIAVATQQLNHRRPGALCARW